MTNAKLPKTINLIKFVESKKVLKGEIKLSPMLRLLEVAAEQRLSGTAQFSIEGKIFSKYIKGLQGQIKAIVPLICQRCMQPFNYEIISDFKLALVFSEEDIEQLPNGFEAIKCSESESDLSCLIEDELLLSIPTVAMHKLSECRIKQDSWVFGTSKESIEKENPFEKLVDLKEKLKGEK